MRVYTYQSFNIALCELVLYWLSLCHGESGILDWYESVSQRRSGCPNMGIWDIRLVQVCISTAVWLLQYGESGIFDWYESVSQRWSGCSNMGNLGY